MKNESSYPAICDPVRGIIDSYMKERILFHCCDRHSDYGIMAMALDKNETLLFTSEGDGRVNMYDYKKMAFLNCFKHGFNIRAIALANNAKFLFTAGYEIYQWDIETVSLISSFSRTEKDPRIITRLAIKKDKKYLAYVSYDTIKICDIESQSCIATLEGHRGWVTSIAFAPSGREIISGGADRSIKVWDIGNAECRLNISEHEDEVTSVAVTHDGKWITSTSQDKTVKVFCVKTGNYLKTFYCGYGVESIAVSKNSRFFVSGGSHGLKLWDFVSEKEVRDFGPGVKEVIMEKSGKFILSSRKYACATDNRLVLRTNIETGDSEPIIQNQGGSVPSMAISPCGVLAAANRLTNGISIYNFEKETVSFVSDRHKDKVKSMVFSPDGINLIAGAWDNDLRIFDAKSCKCKKIISGHNWCVHSVAISKDQKYIASGSWDRTVRLYDGNGTCINTFRGYSNDAVFVAFSYDSRCLFTASLDRKIKIWDVRQNLCIKSYNMDFQEMIQTADGNHVIALRDDRNENVYEIQILDIKTGVCLRSFTTGKGDKSSYATALAKNNEYIAIATRHGEFHYSIKILDLKTGIPVYDDFKLLGSHISSMLITSDGKIITGSDDQTIKIFSIKDHV
ncbi:MAG: WD40 repeat domain-containing protein, partial [Oligoflexales bacterium]|nr:WD40 repeat domain-containing protein [Oligoflexales bacterium]